MDYDELGQTIYHSKDRDETAYGETYYGWSKKFCESMKTKLKGRRDGDRNSSLARGGSAARRYGSSVSSRSRSRSRSSDRRGMGVGRGSPSPYSRKRGRSSSPSRERSYSPPSYPAPGPGGPMHGFTPAGIPPPPPPQQHFPPHQSLNFSPPQQPPFPPSFSLPVPFQQLPGRFPQQGFPPPQFGYQGNLASQGSPSALFPPQMAHMFPQGVQIGPGGVPIPPPRPQNWLGPWPPLPPPPQMAGQGYGVSPGHSQYFGALPPPPLGGSPAGVDQRRR